jgi:hypothetical protein
MKNCGCCRRPGQAQFFCLILVLFLAENICQAQSNQSTGDQLSYTSLQLKILRNDAEIGTATGFVVAKNNKPYLLTNRHVVLACALDKDPSDVGGWICANKLKILHNKHGHLGEWFWVVEDLFDAQGNKRWFEHPVLGGGADLVALPLEHVENVDFYTFDMALATADIAVSPGDSVSIVGFPLGLAQEAGLPIWKTGTVASDFNTNFGGKPMFLVDTTSRPGMSGSPVYAVRTGAFRNASGQLATAISGRATKFLGVYSEQNQAAEIGGVWKAEIVIALYKSLP